MLVKKISMIVILMPSFQLLQVSSIAGRDNSDNCSSSSTRETVGIPALPKSHAGSDLEENYEDLPLKFLYKHKKLGRQLIILQHKDKIACVLAGQCVSYNVNDPLKRTAIGQCPYIPHNVSWCHNILVGFYSISSKYSLAELTDMTCGVYNREGLLCGSCKPGYGPWSGVCI